VLAGERERPAAALALSDPENPVMKGVVDGHRVPAIDHQSPRLGKNRIEDRSERQPRPAPQPADPDIERQLTRRGGSRKCARS
jgi:hypothetical protein